MDFIDDYEEDPDINVNVSETPMGRNQLAVNCSDYTTDNRASNPPTLQSEVRHAMQEAMDRNDYIDLVYRGIGEPNEQYYPPDFPWCTDYAPWGPDQDLQAAEELLNEVGYDDTPITVIVRSENEREVVMSEILTDHFQAAGLNIDRQMLEVGVWTDHLTWAEFDIRPGAGAVEGDPIIFDTGRYMERESPQQYFGGPDNRADEVGELFDQAAVEPEHENRVELYNEGFEIIAEDGSYVMTCHNPQLGGSIPEVENIREHPSLFNTNWRECWFTDPDEFPE
jgi:ABC-type transport system substrate-binding protein